MKVLIVLHGQDWYDFSSDPYIEAASSTFTLSRIQKYIGTAQKQVDEQLVPWSMVVLVDLFVEKEAVPITTVLFSKYNAAKEKLELNKKAKKTSPKKTSAVPYMWDLLGGQGEDGVAAMPQNGQFMNANNALTVAQGQVQAALAAVNVEPNLMDEEEEDD